MDLDAIAGAPLDLANLGLEQNLNSFVNEHILQGRANVGIFPSRELRAGFDQGHLRAKSPDCLRELETHVTTAQHNKVLGQPVEVESFDVRHRIRSHESRQFGDGRAGPEVEEDAVAEDGSGAAVPEIDFNGARSHEASVAHDQFGPARISAIEVHLMEPFDHQPLPSLHGLHVNAKGVSF